MRKKSGFTVVLDISGSLSYTECEIYVLSVVLSSFVWTCLSERVTVRIDASFSSHIVNPDGVLRVLSQATIGNLSHPPVIGRLHSWSLGNRKRFRWQHFTSAGSAASIVNASTYWLFAKINSREPKSLNSYQVGHLVKRMSFAGPSPSILSRVLCAPSKSNTHDTQLQIVQGPRNRYDEKFRR